MNFSKRIHVRIALLSIVGLVAVGSGAAYAALKTGTAAKIGTGVVVIETNLAYQNAAAAGTGMVLTSSGEVLTNNHVIAGATTIKVVVPKTSHAYVARVVGYDVGDDVAVLQLANASNLKTVTIGNAAKLAVGSKVTAVGNAQGEGLLVSAPGRVTGLNRSITAQDDNGDAETLTGLIETNAALQPGDSGGPLLNSAGRVVGMDTAASTGSPFADYAASDAYAIPIGKAVTLAKQIEAGKASSTVHVGGTAFLGVELAGDDTIAGVVSGGPAESAGLAAGDVITSIGGRSVSSPSDVESIVLSLKPGTKVAVAYDDQLGQSKTTTVTLGSGPAQ